MTVLLFIVLLFAILAVVIIVHQKADVLIKTIAEEYRQVLRLKPTKEALNGLAIIAIVILAFAIIMGEEARGVFHVAKENSNSELFTMGATVACLLVTAITLILSIKYVTQK